VLFVVQPEKLIVVLTSLEGILLTTFEQLLTSLAILDNDGYFCSNIIICCFHIDKYVVVYI